MTWHTLDSNVALPLSYRRLVGTELHVGYGGNRDGEVVLASHQCGPRSNPGVDAICGLSLLLVFVPVLRVSYRVLQFSSLHKNQHF